MDKWHVYEFCKANRDVLLQLSYRGQIGYLVNKLPEAQQEVIIEGLEEFRNVPVNNWPQEALRIAK